MKTRIIDLEFKNNGILILSKSSDFWTIDGKRVNFRLKKTQKDKVTIVSILIWRYVLHFGFNAY